MPLAHNGNHQFSIAQSIQDAMRFGSGTPFYSQAPCFGRIGDQDVVGTALTALSAVLIGPLCHFDGINNVAR